MAECAKKHLEFLCGAVRECVKCESTGKWTLDCIESASKIDQATGSRGETCVSVTKTQTTDAVCLKLTKMAQPLGSFQKLFHESILPLMGN